MTSASDTLASRLEGDFISETVSANGTRIHYVRGGSGPPLVLIHGFPQDWYEWRHVMPQVAQRNTVYAVDLRGVGGYDAASLAGDLAAFVDTLGIGPVHVAG